MSGTRDERIRERAHAIWDREGKPDGSDQRHWQQAEQEIDHEDKSSTAKPAAKKTASKKTESASRKTTGAGPALAKRSKDAKKPAKG